MSNRSEDPRVRAARDILDEASRLHTMGATRADLLYYMGRIESAAKMLLDYADDPTAGQRFTLPTALHSFTSTNGINYTCAHCGVSVDREDLWMSSIGEECPGGERQ